MLDSSNPGAFTDEPLGMDEAPAEAVPSVEAFPEPQPAPVPEAAPAPAPVPTEPIPIPAAPAPAPALDDPSYFDLVSVPTALPVQEIPIEDASPASGSETVVGRDDHEHEHAVHVSPYPYELRPAVPAPAIESDAVVEGSMPEPEPQPETEPRPYDLDVARAPPQPVQWDSEAGGWVTDTMVMPTTGAAVVQPAPHVEDPSAAPAHSEDPFADPPHARAQPLARGENVSTDSGVFVYVSFVARNFFFAFLRLFAFFLVFFTLSL
jgi:hypothetical protein